MVKNGEKEYFDRFGNKLDQQGLSLASNTNKTIRITKDSSDDEIEMISSRLKKEGVSFIVNKLKRNNKGEIVHYSINIQLKNSNLVTVKSRSEKNAIDTIVISYDDEGKVRIRHK